MSTALVHAIDIGCFRFVVGVDDLVCGRRRWTPIPCARPAGILAGEHRLKKIHTRRRICGSGTYDAIAIAIADPRTVASPGRAKSSEHLGSALSNTQRR